MIEKNEVEVSRLELTNHLQNKYDNYSSSKRFSSSENKGGQDSYYPDNFTRSFLNDLRTDSQVPSDNYFNQVAVQPFHEFVISP